MVSLKWTFNLSQQNQSVNPGGPINMFKAFAQNFQEFDPLKPWLWYLCHQLTNTNPVLLWRVIKTVCSNIVRLLMAKKNASLRSPNITCRWLSWLTKFYCNSACWTCKVTENLRKKMARIDKAPGFLVQAWAMLVLWLFSYAFLKVAEKFKVGCPRKFLCLLYRHTPQHTITIHR